MTRIKRILTDPIRDNPSYPCHPWPIPGNQAEVDDLSRLRDQLALPKEGELTLPALGDAKPFEVFVQLQRGKPHVHAGTVDAVDAPMALQFAREHFGRDQPCVHLWVVPRDAMLGTTEEDIIWRLTDQSYRLARGYQVHNKWMRFRNKKDLESYEKEDLKEAF
jgi:phenylacetate-CoA oxygenase PaaH subunit